MSPGGGEAALLGTLLGGVAVALGLISTGKALAGRGPRGEGRFSSHGAALRRLLAQIRRVAPRLVELASRRQMGALIARAGLDGSVRPRDVAAARVLCLLTAALLLPRVAQVLPLRMLPLAIPLWCWGATELPLVWLRRRADRRSSALLRELPDALELMRACLAAGLPLRRALLLVGDHCAEPVAGEFTVVAAETAYGIPQATALDGLAARNPLPEIRSLVAAMHQAERHGSPLAPVIAGQAHDARMALNRAIIERGARAGPKIQLVVSMTIVPGAMLGFAAVVIAAIARGDLRFI